LNREFIKRNETGNWVVIPDRVLSGDLMFVVLPTLPTSPLHTSHSYPRTLFAGIVTGSRPDGNRTIFKIKKFRKLASIDNAIMAFLEGKAPPQGNKVLQVWGPKSARKSKITGTVTETKIARDFDSELKIALSFSSAERRRRMKDYPETPKQREVKTTEYVRNPFVVAEVLERAKGICGACRRPAPFNRKSDGRPYLEVHHRQRLADGGKDTVGNTIALCPNCHREQHFGCA